MKRDKPFLVRLTSKEMAWIKKKAGQMGIPIAAYIRYCVHQEKVRG